MNYNWDWGVLIREPYFEWLVSGFLWTISVSLAAWVLAFSLGSVVGIARTTDNKILRGIGTCYVETFRNIPLLVQMFLWYFVFPELLPDDAGMWVKRELPMPEFTTAVVCLGLYTASRVAEQVRAGIEAIGQGQRNAGLAMGLTPAQVYRYVLLPVSYRIIVPPLTSEFLTIFKNSSLALTIGVLETTAQARQIEEYTFQGFEAFTAATLMYIVVTSTVMLLMKLIEGRVRIPGMISLGAK
ncbi:MAG: amino acid ABC transporter permease [Gammaproteobacteria bacterium]|nr:amino acid ABC transporter permease [Gammaproteobacteria bacterium]